MQLFDFQTNLVDNEDNVPMWFGSTLEALQKIEVTIPAKSNCSPVCLCFVLCSNFLHVKMFVSFLEIIFITLLTVCV